MPTIKIGEPLSPTCRDPRHQPPPMRVWAAGTYQHTCPGCGRNLYFTISRPTMIPVGGR